MVKLHLKTLFGKKSELAPILQSLLQSVTDEVVIEDEDGHVLFGSATDDKQNKYPLLVAEEVVGYMKSKNDGTAIAQLLNLFIKKEAEKKKLGSEVLNLYQEINLIFNFSEKLAQTIDAPTICNTTLEQAKHIIRSDWGVVLLWDEEKFKLVVVSYFGDAFFSEETINEQLTFLRQIIFSGQSEIISETRELSERNIISPDVKSLLYSSLKVNQRIMGAIVMASKDDISYTAGDLKMLTTLALQASAAIESALLYEKNIREAKEKEEAMRLVYEVTGKFVPYEFIGSLGHKVITDVKLGDQVQKIVTVLFSDIRDYTTLSEQMSPEENFRFVCSFNERMGPSIRNNKGFINQYLGDAIMAIFPGGAEDALKAAVQMQANVRAINRERLSLNQRPIEIGVGMHTGPLIMGITGDADRMDATTISDTVNTAARLESLTKHYRAGIILSDASLSQIDKSDFHLRYLGLVQLKGKMEPVHIHECFSGVEETILEKKSTTLGVFNDGVENYLGRQFSAAIDSFEQVLEINPQDQTAKFLLANASRYLQKGVPENWNGVVEMMSK